jgi:hypothetical protein
LSIIAEVKTRYAVLCLTVGLLLFGIFGTSEPTINPLSILGGVLILLAVVAFVVRIVKNTAASAAPEQQFTSEQLASMQGLVKEKLQSIEEQRQAIIDNGAREGKTIATESVLRHLEASKAAHQGADREVYIAAVDKLAQEFRQKYPDTIPVDEAYRLMKEWE